MSVVESEESGPGWRMLLGDCLEIMPTLDRVEHVITDPPYEEEAHTKARRALVDSTQKRGVRNSGKVRRIDQPLEIDFDAISPEERVKAATQFASLTKRWVLAFCQIEAVAAWKAAFEASGLEWVRGCIWRKPDGSPQWTGDRPGQGFECFALAHPRRRKKWHGGGKHGVWTCPLDHAHGAGGKADHPTVKPVRLMMELVSDFTDPGDAILDPYTGSGTTGVACLRLGRCFIGIEKRPKYFELACERLRAEENGTTVPAARAKQVPMFGGSR